MENQHCVNIMVLEVHTEMILDVAGDEVVGPRKVNMEMNVSNVRDAMLHVTSVVKNQKGLS